MSKKFQAGYYGNCHCGNEFQRKVGNQVHCSTACRREKHGLWVKGRGRRPCAHCGGEYRPVRRGQKYCRRKCRRAAFTSAHSAKGIAA